MRIGSFFSIIAACFYFVASVIVCTTPKPTPWIKRIKAEDDDTGCLACCTKKQQAKEQDPEEMPEKSVRITDSPADSPDEIAAAVAAGAAAAAAAGTAVVIAADDEEEEDKDNVGGEEDPEAALAASTGDEDQVDETPAPEEDDSPATEGDEEAGDVKGDESAVLSVASRRGNHIRAFSNYGQKRGLKSECEILSAQPRVFYMLSMFRHPK